MNTYKNIITGEYRSTYMSLGRPWKLVHTEDNYTPNDDFGISSVETVVEAASGIIDIGTSFSSDDFSGGGGDFGGAGASGDF